MAGSQVVTSTTPVALTGETGTGSIVNMQSNPTGAILQLIDATISNSLICIILKPGEATNVTTDFTNFLVASPTGKPINVGISANFFKAPPPSDSPGGPVTTSQVTTTTDASLPAISEEDLATQLAVNNAINAKFAALAPSTALYQFYVNSDTGNDLNAGTQASPFQSCAGIRNQPIYSLLMPGVTVVYEVLSQNLLINAGGAVQFNGADCTIVNRNVQPCVMTANTTGPGGSSPLNNGTNLTLIGYQFLYNGTLAPFNFKYFYDGGVQNGLAANQSLFTDNLAKATINCPVALIGAPAVGATLVPPGTFVELGGRCNKVADTGSYTAAAFVDSFVGNTYLPTANTSDYILQVTGYAQQRSFISKHNFGYATPIAVPAGGQYYIPIGNSGDTYKCTLFAKTPIANNTGNPGTLIKMPLWLLVQNEPKVTVVTAVANTSFSISIITALVENPTPEQITVRSTTAVFNYPTAGTFDVIPDIEMPLPSATQGSFIWVGLRINMSTGNLAVATAKVNCLADFSSFYVAAA